MTLPDLDLTEFPAFPPYCGEWAAFYYEPVPTSGERLTIAVAAWDAEGIALVETLEPGILPAQYDGMVRMLVDMIRRQLADGGIAAVSVSGIFVGPVRTGMGTDRHDLMLQGVSLTSSLSKHI